jgi:hypothetical protein
MNPSNQAQSALENLEKPNMLRQLNDYESLVSERNRYALLERNAEQNRHTVRPHIYARVKNEYADRRGSLDQEEERQRGILRALFDNVLEKRKALNERCREAADRLEELDFRVRVGEFEEEEMKESRTGLKEQLLQITKALADAQEIVDKFEQIGMVTRPPSAVAQTDGEDWGEASETQADYLVLEEDPHSADQDSPVVNYPIEFRASSSQADTGKRAKAPDSRTRHKSRYVAGYLVALDGSRKGERFPLISSEITVGSSRGIDIRLADSGIARYHARIIYRRGKHYLETVAESGSCLVNGVQANRAELKDGDVLCLGKTKMQVEYAREATA